LKKTYRRTRTFTFVIWTLVKSSIKRR